MHAIATLKHRITSATPVSKEEALDELRHCLAGAHAERQRLAARQAEFAELATHAAAVDAQAVEAARVEAELERRLDEAQQVEAQAVLEAAGLAAVRAYRTLRAHGMAMLPLHATYLEAIRAHERARMGASAIRAGQVQQFVAGRAVAKNGRELPYSPPMEDFSAWDEA